MKKALFNPLENNSPVKLLLIGLLFTAIGCVLASYFNARYVGVLDLDFAESQWWKPVLDNVINIFCSTLVLYLTGLYFNKKTRILDIFAISVFCRYPFYLLPIFNIHSTVEKGIQKILNALSENSMPQLELSTNVFFLIFAVIALLMLVWFLINLYNAFQVAANAKGNKAVLMFILSIIIMHILSKIGNYLIIP